MNASDQPASETPHYEYFDVASTEEIDDGTGLAFEAGDQVVAIFHVGDNFYAIDDACPHMGASLSTGHVADCVVSCPWHAWRFDIRDGTWRDNPRVAIGSYPVRILNGRIHVGIPMKPDATHTSQEGGAPDSNAGLSLGDFQQLIRKMYYEKDVARGVEGTFMWLMEEMGELSSALRERNRANQMEEFADVLAWLCTIANVCDIDLSEAIRLKYGGGCPGCCKFICVCPDSEKP